MPRSVPLVLALCPVVITIIAIVDRLELALACLLEQSRDVTAVQRTGELQRLIDPHADAFAEQFFRSHRWTELSCALGFGAELDQPRELWPDTKIILLFERALSTDYQNWQASEIDGCIPLSVSTNVLIGTLQRILDGNLKILFQDAASRSVIALPSARLPIAPVVTHEEARIDAFDSSFSIRVRHGLSEREEQVLRDLVKGLPNKMIARKRDIAEATVKVHLKSILRKIRVANRTQAAIWALENGYAANNLHPEPPRLEAVQLAPLRLLSPSAT